MRKKRTKRFLKVLSLILPFALPAGVFVFWLAYQCQGQDGDPLHIVAYMDPDGGRTTTFSTILPDGNEAVWECSDGTFIETGDVTAAGRTVTWQPRPGLEDSVLIVITTSAISDTVRFLPVIPDVIPSLTVSAAYNLAILERARSIQIAPGNYRAISMPDALRGYDGLVMLIVKTQQDHRVAFCMLPGDTVELILPLGGTIQAAGLDEMEDAMDNSGNVQIVFEILSEPSEEPPSSGEQQ